MGDWVAADVSHKDWAPDRARFDRHCHFSISGPLGSFYMYLTEKNLRSSSVLGSMISIF